MIHMDQMMILSEPSIIILWTYQDMMEWMSRILFGGMAGEDFGFWLRISWSNVADLLSSSHSPSISTLSTWTIDDDPFRTINYHPLDISGHDGLGEQDIGWRNGWCW
jgi:hypothetical protein